MSSPQAIVSDIHTGGSFCFIGRLAGEDVDHSSHCISTIQRALWSAQNFDSFDILHSIGISIHVKLYHPIYIYRNSGIIGGGRDSADTDCIPAISRMPHIYIWENLGKILSFTYPVTYFLQALL